MLCRIDLYRMGSEPVETFRNNGKSGSHFSSPDMPILYMGQFKKKVTLSHVYNDVTSESHVYNDVTSEPTIMQCTTIVRKTLKVCL
jgi:hypothetical protein